MLDLTSLYTNIPNLEGFQATARFLVKHRKFGNKPEPCSQTICQLLNTVLTMNNFRVNNNHYLQVAGTAMGTRVAPTYANIFMADFERKFVDSYPKQPKFWVRLIDDILLICEDELQKFITHLNTVHKSIKFTSESSTTEVNFLDTCIHRTEDGKLTTDLYIKPTDSNNYLLYSSAHPPHCKRSIPYSQFLRIRRICTEKADFVKHCIDKSKHLLRRGYPHKLLKETFTQALKKDRGDLLKTHQREKGETPNILITTYNPGFNGLKEVVKKNWDILGRSCTTREIHRRDLLPAFRRPKNLWDTLVRARLSKTVPTERSTAPCNPCNTRNCRYCPRINKTGRVTCTASNRSCVTKYNVTCKSSNLIYCLSCKRCGIQYMGQTKNRLMDRFQAHFYNIGHNKPNSEIGRHFNQPDHKGLEDVEIHILDFIHANPAGMKAKYLRDLIEFNWIQRMHTNAPMGLDVMDPFWSTQTGPLFGHTANHLAFFKKKVTLFCDWLCSLEAGDILISSLLLSTQGPAMSPTSHTQGITPPPGFPWSSPFGETPEIPFRYRYISYDASWDTCRNRMTMSKTILLLLPPGIHLPESPLGLWT